MREEIDEVIEYLRIYAKYWIGLGTSAAVVAFALEEVTGQPMLIPAAIACSALWMLFHHYYIIPLEDVQETISDIE